MNRPKRILAVGEASYLATGYATYNNEVLTRLYKTGKYELAELGCYGCFEDSRTARIPWKFYGGMPKPGTEQHRNFMNNPINSFGKERFENILLDFKPDIVFDIRDYWMMSYQEKSPFRKHFHWCFSGKTPVLVQDGMYKNIDEIKIGDVILDGEYNPTKIKNISKRKEKKLLKVKTSGYGIGITTTKEHKFFCIPNKGRVFNNKTRRYYKNENFYDKDMALEIAADNLKKGDMLVFPPVKVNIDKSIDYNNHLAILVGYFISEGTCDNYGHIRFTIHEKEDEYATEIIEAIKYIYPDKKIENRIVKNAKCRIIGINDKKEVNDFWLKFYDENGYKIMPSWVFNSPQSFISEVIRCMWRGDGCVVKNSHNYNGLEYFTNSKQLSLQLWQSLLRLKIVSNVIYRKNSGYRFFIYGNNAQKLQNIVNKKNTSTELQFLKTGEILKNRAWIDKNGYLIVKITDIETIENEEFVYDIEVESKSHTFLVPYKVHNCIMPTIDAEPQDNNWIGTYMSADSVFCYTDWGVELLKKQSGGLINVIGSCPPGGDIENFKPVQDRDSFRQSIGFDSGLFIVGTMMRNQCRKLYPNLLDAFNQYLDKCKKQNEELYHKSFLYIHTTYPDLGWEIPELIIHKGLSKKVILTYYCQTCQYTFPSFFIDPSIICHRCNSSSCGTPTTGAGTSREELCKILNTFDAYVQYASNEGFGMPQVEAACCGVPVFATDYSAMSDVVRKINGFPINVKAYYYDGGTKGKRAIPDNDDFVEKLYKFATMPKQMRLRKGMEARIGVEKHYDWNKISKKWEDLFDSIDVSLNKPWNSQPIILNPEINIPNINSNEALVSWCFENILGLPELINSHHYYKYINDLNYGHKIQQSVSLLSDDMSVLSGDRKFQSFTREDFIKEMRIVRSHINYWEQKRVGMISEPTPDYILGAN